MSTKIGFTCYFTITNISQHSNLGDNIESKFAQIKCCLQSCICCFFKLCANLIVALIQSVNKIEHFFSCYLLLLLIIVLSKAQDLNQNYIRLIILNDDDKVPKKSMNCQKNCLIHSQSNKDVINLFVSIFTFSL